MKRLLIILFTISAFYAWAQEKNEKVHWYTFEEAMELQKKSPKKIFIDVYTDWCGFCKKMDKETFANPVIARYLNEHFYPVKFNAEQDEDVVFNGTTYVNNNKGKRSSHELAQALLQGRMSYPSFVFFNKKAEIITVVPGYYPPKRFEPIIHFFGEDAYQNKEWEEFSKTFKSNL